MCNIIPMNNTLHLRSRLLDKPYLFYESTDTRVPLEDAIHCTPSHKVHLQKTPICTYVGMYNSFHSLSVAFVGCSPIRSLIESGFVENNKTGVSLFYGVRNLQRMAYQVGLCQLSCTLCIVIFCI